MKHIITTYRLDFKLLKNGAMLTSLEFLNLGRNNDIYTGVDLFIDTGASSTIMSRTTLLNLGYQRIKPKSWQMVEMIDGYLKCYSFKIPSFCITGSLVVKEPIIWVPDNSDCVDNVLGQDVLREYNYYVDNVDNCIYFEPKYVNNLRPKG